MTKKKKRARLKSEDIKGCPNPEECFKCGREAIMYILRKNFFRRRYQIICLDCVNKGW